MLIWRNRSDSFSQRPRCSLRTGLSYTSASGKTGAKAAVIAGFE
jgi:hypothetical protein